MSLETQEQEDDKVPRKVAHHVRNELEMKALALLERKERRHLDNDEAKEREAGQTYVGINLFS